MTLEKNQQYWMTPGETPVVEPVVRGKEFVSDPRDDRPEAGEFSRREFLKLMGIASVLAGSAACARRPVEKIIPYLNKPEETTLGVPLWYASVAHDSFGEYGVLVKTREGRPIKLEGNPDHPVTLGGLTAQGQSAVWDLYDPDRLQQPLRRDGRTGNGTAATLAEADAAMRNLLSRAAAKAGSVRVYSHPVTGVASRRMLQTFQTATNGGAAVTAWPMYSEEIAQGRALAFGDAALPQYRFDKANYVVSLGADFLGTWGNPVAQTKGWSATRKLAGSSAAMSRLVCFEPLMTLTGTNADERYPVRSADLLKVALGIAHELLVVRLNGKFVDDAELLAPYALAKVAPQVGVPAEVLRRVASELLAARGKSLVVAGTATGALGVALQGVANLLNAALDNEGATIDSVSRPWTRDAGDSTADLIADMQRGAVDVLIIAGANPVYELPVASGFAAALTKVGTVIHLTRVANETSQHADWVLPLSHFLESWGDATLTSNIHSIVQPTIQPLYASRSLPATLLAWTDGKIASDAGDAAWHTQLQADWERDVYPATGKDVPFDDFWNGVLRSGVVTLAANKTAVASARPAAVWTAVNTLREQLQQPTQELEVVCYPTVALGDGRSANASWLQELPDPVTKITWDNYACVAPRTAATMELAEGQIINLRVGDKTVALPVHVQPGTHDGVIAVPLGYGRTHAGRVGNGVGVRIHDLASVSGGSLWWGATVSTVQATSKHVKLACIQGHHRIEGRQILQETTLAAYRDNPEAGKFAAHGGGEHEGPVQSLWGAPIEYHGYRWAMAVDLNSCTGCSACMLACMVENNVPAVGKTQVLRGREMHWMRIDRYYAGEDANPSVIHQPMMCQQCEKAPCETVCPVLATVHDADGLNVQIYNRCVGTRYCSNNCPYKVRRFNWFDYGNNRRPDDYAWAAPLHLMLNPEVTVREKGVMEKCTFCIQRVRTGKEAAKFRGDTVRDGEIQTACQQSCPANAIVFGNVNDPHSAVAAVRKNPRGFSVLGELNILPQVTYLTKVRNTVVV